MKVVKRLPRQITLSTEMVPPCCSTNRLVMAMPSPGASRGIPTSPWSLICFVLANGRRVESTSYNAALNEKASRARVMMRGVNHVFHKTDCSWFSRASSAVRQRVGKPRLN